MFELEGAEDSAPAGRGVSELASSGYSGQGTRIGVARHTACWPSATAWQAAARGPTRAPKHVLPHPVSDKNLINASGHDGSSKPSLQALNALTVSISVGSVSKPGLAQSFCVEPVTGFSAQPACNPVFSHIALVPL
jgi:hypothetical protein